MYQLHKQNNIINMRHALDGTKGMLGKASESVFKKMFGGT
jgi:hypothetical protein